MEIIALIIVMAGMVSIIIVSYGKQQEKHRRMREWMKENKRSQNNAKKKV
jgi:predicted histidine transporter YuiF (NhaC family)